MVILLAFALKDTSVIQWEQVVVNLATALLTVTAHLPPPARTTDAGILANILKLVAKTLNVCQSPMKPLVNVLHAPEKTRIEIA